MVKGINEVMKALENISDLDRKALMDALKPAAKQILYEMLDELDPHERTGTLSLSFKLHENKRRIGWTVGPRYGKGGGNHWNVFDLGFQHRSGKKVPGHFIERKVFDKNKKASLELMSKELAALVERTYNK